MRRIALLVPLLLLTSMLAAGAPMAAAGGCGGGEGSLPMGEGGAFSAPGPPQNLTVAAGNRNVVLLWDPPEFDGGGVDFYRVYVDGVRTKRTTETQAQVNKLNNGQSYAFTVTANNVCGESSPSNEVTATPNRGQDAELIGGSNLSMSTGNGATSADPFVGKQTFPAGTTGLGTLKEEPDNGFCNGPCLANQVLVNALENGNLGGPFYTVRLLYDKTVVEDVPTPDAAAEAVTGFIVWYDATKDESPVQLSSCSSSSPPCVARLKLDDGDLEVLVRTSDLDPRMGTK
jgi:fibronectin type III domain protein